MRIVSLLVASLFCAVNFTTASSQEQTENETERLEELTVDEVITVVGQKSRRDLRLEVQEMREQVYGLFNELNSNDEFDVHCENVTVTGSRIPHRVCRPQFAINATSDAGGEFARSLQSNCAAGILDEGCLASGLSRAQAEVSQIATKDQQFDAEVQRLARENADFRRAMGELRHRSKPLR